MAHHRAPGLTRDEPAPLNLHASDRDNVTIISLQASSNTEHKTPSFPPGLLPSGRSSPRRKAGKWGRPMQKFRKFGVTLLRATTSCIVEHIISLIPSTEANATEDCTGSISGLQSGSPPPKLADAPIAHATTKCTVCQLRILTQHNDRILIPCGHYYHIDCFRSLVETSLHPASPFPPQCCSRDIPVDVFAHHLTHAQRMAFASRLSERATPKRVYVRCANTRCRHPLLTRDTTARSPVHIFTCPSEDCGTRTCALCEAYVAPGVPRDQHQCARKSSTRHAATKPATGRREESEWVRCPKCKRRVERRGRCGGTMCLCGTRFCRCCGAPARNRSSSSWGVSVPAPDLKASPRPSLRDIVISCGLHAQARRRRGPWRGTVRPVHVRCRDAIPAS